MTNTLPLTTASRPPSPARRPAGPLWTGLALLLGGTGLLLATGPLGGDNWWAIFILLPALASLAGAAVALHLDRGAFGLSARLNLAVGLPTLVTALIFIFRLSWSIGWTLMLITAGLVILLNGLTALGRPLGSAGRAAAELAAWIGLSVTALGLTFWLDRLGVINLVTLFGAARWWDAFVVLPGLGALLSALHARQGRGSGARLLAAAGLLLLAAAAGDTFNLAWRWYGPLLLILAGLVVIWPASFQDNH